jgi:predicted  nucleic acid-binding Zn-ribbon protein
MQQRPNSEWLDEWPVEPERSDTGATNHLWHELFEAREALQAAQEKEGRLLQLLAEARELLLEFQSQTAAAETRALQAEGRAEAAEAELQAARSVRSRRDEPNFPLDPYESELNRLRAMIKSADNE